MSGLGQPCDRCVDCKEKSEAVEDQPLAVVVMQGRTGPRYMCGECAADWRALDAQEEHAAVVASALEGVADVIETAEREILGHAWEAPEGRRFDAGGSEHEIARTALTVARLCGEAIARLQTARTACERAVGRLATTEPGWLTEETGRQRTQGVGDRRERS